MKRFIFLLMIASLLSACGGEITEADVQTAIAEAIQETPVGDSPDIGGASQDELNETMQELEQANFELTQQAEALAEMQQQIEVLNYTPTPTITPTTAPPTPTPKPNSGLPEGTVYAIARNKINLYKIKGYNAANYPIMGFPKDRVLYFENDWLVVTVSAIRVDGGGYFYEVVAPYGAGLFVRTADVTLKFEE